MRCMVSALRKTRAPRRSSSTGKFSSGVRTATPASVFAAASTSAKVGMILVSMFMPQNGRPGMWHGQDRQMDACYARTPLIRASSRALRFPQGFEAAAECLGRFREQPRGDARGRFRMLGLAIGDERQQARAPRRERLMRLGQMHQHREILERAEPVAQALRLVDPDAPEPRPGRLDQFHLVAMLDHAAAQFVQIVGVRAAPIVSGSALRARL